nr:hydroxylase [Rhodococcus wratislaviensis]
MIIVAGERPRTGYAWQTSLADTLGCGAMEPNTPASSDSTIPADHPGVSELFAVLAYGEISAFYRLSEDAQMARTLQGKVALASMAAAEMGHFEMLEKALTARGFDIFEAMDPFVRALDNYHASTTPSTWLEALVKAYVGDGIAADFYREIGHSLPAEVSRTVEEVLSQTGHSEFVVHEVQQAIKASNRDKDRLMLWGRRLLGEAITQAQFVLAQREALTELVISASGDLNGVVALFDRMQEMHAERMAVLGLV